MKKLKKYYAKTAYKYFRHQSQNGNFMPDYSILPILCKTLNITINELLSGEKLTDESYQQKLEENLILNIAELKRKTKRTFSFIFKMILSFLLIFFILNVLEFINNRYDYKKYYLSNKDISIITCINNNLILQLLKVSCYIYYKNNKPNHL